MKVKLVLGLSLFTLFARQDCACAATTRTWDGGGTNNLWTTVTNWVGDVAPVAGDGLIFPAAAARLSNSNNFVAGTVFDSITFSGSNYVITGNAITNNAGLTNNSPAGTSNTFNCPLTLAGNQTFVCATNTTLILNGALNVNGKSLTFDSGGTAFANGVISGPVGSLLVKSGGGSLRLAGNNTYPGNDIRGGTLFVNGFQPFSDVLLNGGTLGGSGRVGVVTSAGGGTVSPGASPGILAATAMAWNSNTIFFVELTGFDDTDPAFNQNDQVFADTVNLSNATLVVSPDFPNGFDTFVIIHNTGTNPVVGTFAGLPEGATTNFSGLDFRITYVGDTGNDVVLQIVNFAQTWDGGAFPDVNWSNRTNWVGNIPMFPTTDAVFPSGAAGLTNFNDLTNNFLLSSVVIAGSGSRILGSNQLKIVDFAASHTNGEVSFFPPLAARVNPLFITNASGGTLNLNGDIHLPGSDGRFDAHGTIVVDGSISNGPFTVIYKDGPGVLRLQRNNAITNFVVITQGTLQLLHDRAFGTASVDVQAGARLELLAGRVVTNQMFIAGVLFGGAAGDSNQCSGPITLEAANATVEVASNGILALVGQVSGGANGLTKAGAGQLFLTGPNNYTGSTLINDGTVFVNTTQPGSRVRVNAGGTLGGNGQVGALTNNTGGTVTPGNNTNTTATLRAFGGATLQSGSVLQILLNGTTPGSGYSQLQVSNGPVVLNSPLLNLVWNFTPAVSDVFVVLTNQNPGAVTGTFTGLPEGAVFTNAGIAFQITYAGGDGNDVTITRFTGAPPPPPPPAIPFSSGTYTQNFNTLAISGSANTWSNGFTLPGWYAAQSLSPFSITTYRASTGSDITADLHSYGSSSTNERALGSLASGTPGTIGYGLCFTNDTATSVGNFLITYTGEQWRNGSSAVTNTLTFWYRVSASALTNPEPGTAVNWTPVTSLNFASPTVLAGGTALDGNQTTNRQSFPAVLIPGLVVTPGQNVFFRWLDADDTGNDNGMAVDDLTVAFSIPAPRITSIISNPANGFKQISAVGESNLTYGIEAVSNLNSPIFWLPIGSNTANGAGLFQFTDTNTPALPQRYYRLRWP